MKRRFTQHFSVSPNSQIGLPATHAAVLHGRTLFPSSVQVGGPVPAHSCVWGEPKKNWRSGNEGSLVSMPFSVSRWKRGRRASELSPLAELLWEWHALARRHKHGEAFERKLEQEIAAKQRECPDGFVVRVHILGDFYSPIYVVLWRRWLRLFPALRLFGYSHMIVIVG